MTHPNPAQEEAANLRSAIANRKRALARAGLPVRLRDQELFEKMEARIREMENEEAPTT